MDEQGISNDLQIGLERDHRIANHLLVLQTVLDQAKACQQNAYIAFIDLKQVYDRIDRKLLLDKMIDLGVPSKIISIP